MLFLHFFSHCIPDPFVEGHLLLFIKPFGFLVFSKIIALVSVNTSWHITYVQKLAYSFTSCSHFQVVPSEEVKFTCPDSEWRNLLQKLITDFTWIQISVILLLLKIGCKKLIDWSNLPSILFVELKLVIWSVLGFIKELSCVEEVSLDKVWFTCFS